MYTKKQRVEFIDKVTERDMINMLEAREMLAELESWDPVNMPDPIRKRFGYGGQLRPACSQNRAGSYMPDPASFSVRFSKEGMGHTMQNRPGSDLDGLARVWLHSSGLKASWCAGIIGPGFWQDATGLLLVSHFQTRLRSSTDVPDNSIQNQPGADLVLADCAGFWPNGSRQSGSKPVCKNHTARFWPVLPNRSGPDANRIRHVYWDRGMLVETCL